MVLTKRQRKILLGTLLGDGRLQCLSNKSARLRIEHSIRQKFYVWWKYREFKEIMQDKPEIKKRKNPIWKKVYRYCRCQTLCVPELKRFHGLFYNKKRKIISPELKKLFTSPLSLAVWYMDDGYYYRRDNTAYIYLSEYSLKEYRLLQEILRENFGLIPHLYQKKGGYCFYFPVKDTKKLIKIVQPYILKRFKYKISSSPRND